MTKHLSKQLAAVLKFGLSQPTVEIDIGQLRREYMAAIDVGASLYPVPGLQEQRLSVTKILFHLKNVSNHDSAVHDIVTTGHLGKMLSRFDHLANYNLVALPHAVFDKLSQQERSEFFASGKTLHSLSKDEVELGQAIVAREKIAS